MKKNIQIALITALMAGMIGTPAMAAETDRGFLGVDTAVEVTVVPAAFAGEVTERTVETGDAEATLYAGSDQLLVTLPQAPAGEYLVLLAAGSGLPATAEDILYIDQKTGNGSELQFTVYPLLPEATQAMTLFITSSVMETAAFSVQYYVQGAELLGDVTGDGVVDAADLTVLARHVARIERIDATALLANADVNSDGDVTSSDLTKMAQYLAKIIDTLE